MPPAVRRGERHHNSAVGITRHRSSSPGLGADPPPPHLPPLPTPSPASTPRQPGKMQSVSARVTAAQAGVVAQPAKASAARKALRAQVVASAQPVSAKLAPPSLPAPVALRMFLASRYATRSCHRPCSASGITASSEICAGLLQGAVRQSFPSGFVALHKGKSHRGCVWACCWVPEPCHVMIRSYSA